MKHDTRKRRRGRLPVFLLAALLLCLSAPVSAAPKESEDPAEEPPAFDGYLVTLTDGGLSLQAAAKGTGSLEPVFENTYHVRDLADIEGLAKAGLVAHIEPDYYVTLFDLPGAGAAGAGSESGSSGGWGYEAMAAPCAEALELRGEGIRIAVIDSGVDRLNSDLQNADIAEGYDFTQDTPVLDDTVYHGTKVIQVLAGEHNSIGGTGAARGAEIVPLCCFSTMNNGTVSMLVQAIEAAVDSYDCDVINMSWGLKNDSETLHQAIRYAREAGAILVAAAGNVTSSFRQGTAVYPAAYEEVISVAAVDPDLTALATSQQNGFVCVCAPGGQLPFVDRDGLETTDSGTSFASPFVAAAAAVLKQLAPFLDQEQLLCLLQERSVDLGEAGCDLACGYGLPKLDALLGSHWSTLAANETGGSADAGGWTVGREGGYVLWAVYGAGGRLLETGMHSVALPAEAFSFSTDREDAAGCSLFYLDAAFRPTDSRDTRSFSPSE